MLKIQLVYRVQPDRGMPVVKVITFPEVAPGNNSLQEILESCVIDKIPAEEIISLTIIGE